MWTLLGLKRQKKGLMWTKQTSLRVSSAKKTNKKKKSVSTLDYVILIIINLTKILH
jgi:hypothetical protein